MSSNPAPVLSIQSNNFDVASYEISKITVKLDKRRTLLPTLHIQMNNEWRKAELTSESKGVILGEFRPAIVLLPGSTVVIQCRQNRIKPPWKQVTLVNRSFSYERAERLDIQSAVEHDLGGSPSMRIYIAPDTDSMQKMQQKARELPQAVLERIGRWRPAVEKVREFGKVLSELNPIAKAVVGVVDVIYQMFEKQAQTHDLLLRLVDGVMDSTSCVTELQRFKTSNQLTDRLEALNPLVTEAWELIRVYERKSQMPVKDLILGTGDAEKMADLKRRLDEYKDLLDRSLLVDTREIAFSIQAQMARLDSSSEQERLLSNLKYNVRVDTEPRLCQDLTRVKILKEAEAWLQSDIVHTDVDMPILWISGLPGAGKSCVANTLVKRLRDEGRNVVYFGFDQNLHADASAKVLWLSVAYQLADQFARPREVILDALKLSPRVKNLESSTYSDVFSELVAKALVTSSTIPQNRAPIVVIDALDECGGDSSAGRREALLVTLSRWAELRLDCRLLVTSRDETDIRKVLSPISKHVTLCAGNNVDEDSASDIRQYTQRRLDAIAARASYSGRGWPDSAGVDELAKRAAGLFIWAKTACDFIDSGVPRARMKELLGSHTKVADMGGLYSMMLHRAFSSPSHTELDSISKIMGTMIASSIPLTDEAMVALIVIDDNEREIAEDSVIHLRNRLRSVLDDDSVLKFAHLSFPEFLQSSECPQEFRVNSVEQHHRLALRTLGMLRKLRFNICNLKTSYVLNDDVPDLANDVETEISSSLSYACQFWPNHLLQTSFDSELSIAVWGFLRQRALFWLEAMSLLKKTGMVSQMLTLLAQWSSDYDQDMWLFAGDAAKFGQFSATVMVQSTPHIYLSALPFAPLKSLFAVHYRSYFPRTLSLDLGALDTWPVQQMLIQGHSSIVNTVVFSPDGNRLVSGSNDKTIRIWDAATGQALRQPMQGHESSVHSVVFSPNGKHLASGSHDKTIRIWDADTGEAVGLPLQGHDSPVTSVVFSPNGKHLASGSWDKTIRIWDADTGKAVGQPLKGHDSPIWSVVFSPNGKHLVSSSHDYTIRIWDADTGEAVGQSLQGHTDSVSSVVFSPNGKHLASGSWDRTIRIWDADTGEAVGQPLKGHEGSVLSVVFSPDGKHLASGSHDNTIRTWDADTGKAVGQPLKGHEDSVQSVVFSPNGKHLASGSWDQTIQIWDADTGQAVEQPLQGHGSSVMSVVFSPDGKYLASGSGDKTIQIWDTFTSEAMVQPLQGHEDTVLSVVFSPNGKYLASGSWDKSIRIWDVYTGQAVGQPLQGHDSIVSSVVFSPNGKHLASGSHDKTVQIWDADTGEAVGQPLQGHDSPVTCVVFSPNGKHLASGSGDKTIQIWDADTGQAVGQPLQGHESSVLSVVFSPDGKHLASGSDDKTIRIWNADTGEAVGLPLQGHDSSVFSVVFSPNGKHLASGSHDNTIRIWDVDTSEAVGQPLQGHEDSVWSVVFSPNGKHLASGSDDKTIRIWDADTGEAVEQPLQVQDQTVMAVAPSKKHLASRIHNKRVLYQPLFNIFLSQTTVSQGWAFAPDLAHRLFYVPPHARPALWRQDNVAVISQHPQTKISFTKFVHGSDWASCYDGRLS